MTMAMTLTASSLLNLPCRRCRDLTSNLIKSVNAFEILATGNKGYPAAFLISAIRQLISKAVASYETEKSQDPKNRNTRADSQQKSHENDKKTSNHLYQEIAEKPDRYESENLLCAPLESKSDSQLVKQTQKRKRQRTPKPAEKNILDLKMNKIPVTSNEESSPRRSGTKPRELSSLPGKTQQNATKSGLKPTSLVSDGKENRPIATKEDFDRANQKMRKLKMDTPDGLYYYLYECTICSQKFPCKPYNVRRHIMGQHFNRRILHKSSKTVVPQLSISVPDEKRNTSKPLKVQLYGPKFQGAKNHSTNRKSRPLMIKFKFPTVTNLTKMPGEKIPAFKKNKKKKSSNRRRLPLSSFSPASPLLIKPSILFPVLIPSNLTVRNPHAYFDLEKTLNARVRIELIPNLTSVRGLGSGQSQRQNTMTVTRTLDENVMVQITRPHTTEILAADSNTMVKAESPHNKPPKVVEHFTCTSSARNCGENAEENSSGKVDVAGCSGQSLPYFLIDLTDLDEGTSDNDAS